MSKTISFQHWVATKARARGPAADEITKLRVNCPEYKNAKMYATKYPLAMKNYANYCRRGSQAA